MDMDGAKKDVYNIIRAIHVCNPLWRINLSNKKGSHGQHLLAFYVYIFS